MKTGIIGGTFNPIHVGHLAIAREMQQRFELDRVLFIPAAAPPHKQLEGLPPFSQRLAMVECAIVDHPGFELCDIEGHRQGKSYSLDTLKQLHTLYPQDTFYFLIGMDSLNSLHTWYHFEEIFPLCHLVVARRPGTVKPASTDALPVAIRGQFCYDSVLKTFCHDSGSRLYFLTESFIDISSTEIRDRIADNRSVEKSLPKAVYEYIKTHHVYASGKG
nr:nicotinate-nucleotide adenylyltransferase [uncultured Desulfuromonas sp.]